MLVSKILPVVVVVCLYSVGGEKTNGGSVERLWGVADTMAIVGKSFSYHIPNDAFSGTIARYEVSMAGRTELPSWLHFNSKRSILEGVPLDGDVGQHYITITAIGREHDVAKDVFSIEVMPASHENRPTPLRSLNNDGVREIRHCDKDDENLRLVVTVDLDPVVTNSLDRVQLLDKLSQYLKVEKDELQLLPRSVQNSLGANSVRAGPGDAIRVNTPDTVLTWPMGCGGTLLKSDEDILQKLDLDARDGTLSSQLGFPVVGWHVAKYARALSRRIKRQQYSGSSTPVPAIYPTRPLYIPEDNWNTQAVRHELDETEVQPPSHVVPTMASPNFVEPSHRHRSKSQHRFKTTGRHNHHHRVTASPFYPYHDNGLNLRQENYVYGTPFPTVGIRQTAGWVEPSRSIPDEISLPLEPSELIHPTHVMSSPVFSDTHSERTDDIRPTVTPDRQPILWNRIPKVQAVAGKYFSFLIPNDTFYDPELGYTRNLRLNMTEDIGSEKWLQFDERRQTVYGLPVKNYINMWERRIHAFNRYGDSVDEVMDISVEQHELDRVVNHEFEIEVEHDKHVIKNLVDRNIELLKRLRKLYNESGSMAESNITVLAFTQTTFTWCNDTLIRNVSVCPYEEIKELYSKLLDGKQKLSYDLFGHLSPEFVPSHAMPRVQMRWLGQCAEYGAQPTFVTHINHRPEVLNPIDFINVTEGEPFQLRIPADTFRDVEQTELTVVLLDELSAPLPNNSWIRFDSSQQALVGLPMQSDVGSHNLQLVAYDSEGLHISEFFKARVDPRPPRRRYPIEFGVELKFDFDLFQSDLRYPLLVMDKLVYLYSDKMFNHIVVQDIRKGSVIFKWTNNTLPEKPCPKEKIRHLLEFLKTEDGTMTPNLTNAFWPEFNVTKVHVMPLESCVGEMTPTSVVGIPSTTLEPKQATSVDDIYISTIVPAIVIAAMLLIAAIVACVLYRKKRKGKMSMEDSNTFVKRGAPVIFTHELEEKSDSAKAPMIMKEEKPPLPPPEYPRTSSGSSSPSTPPSQARGSGRRSKSPYHHHPTQHATAPTIESSPLYQPPPPVTANRDNRMHWPKHALTYRMPPPYVPP